MRILTFLNVSNLSRMQADSGYIFYNLLSPYFTKQNSFYFASPEPLSDCNCIHINKEFGFNKYEVRFSFDWSKVMEIISKVSPDVLIVNQVEQVPHYKAIIQALGINVSIVSYAHYIPYLFVNNVFQYDESLNNGGIGFSVCMSFLSGLEMSDVVFTHSQTSKDYLRKLYAILRVMAMELKAIVEEYATVDWSKKKDTRAKMRMQIKRLLKKYNYPPDYTEEAISRVVDQAEFMM